MNKENEACIHTSEVGKKINGCISAVFLCGSLEPGKDGVGDYTRRLVQALNKRGHRAGVISLADKAATEVYSGIQGEGASGIEVLRLPAFLPWQKRIDIAGSWIERFDPEWLSLQYVPFAFHAKGLHIQINFLLGKLGRKRRWHFMFHELWVGLHQDAPLKLKVWGQAQKQLIRFLYARLAPSVVHTQVELYQIMLRQLHINSQLLPLFSNFSKHQTSSSLPKRLIQRKRTNFLSLFLEVFIPTLLLRTL